MIIRGLIIVRLTNSVHHIAKWDEFQYYYKAVKFIIAAYISQTQLKNN